MNAKGVDVSYCKGRVTGEFVAQCTAGQDVETYATSARDLSERCFAFSRTCGEGSPVPWYSS